ncbi:hypothetical protein [Streptomyces xiaopingdaonensis]|uniref:hypothetical protein n=1 Tax=Streptomyces xiaopingdaonensis TaxID=1565415 RepID=UPI00036CBD82|nr:hypothetical protein [Streptomyces xiaopingdaonensis]
MTRRLAYRCEAIAQDLTGSCEVVLSTYRAMTPRLAAGWARHTARRYAGLLAPVPTAGYLLRAPLTETAPDGPRPEVVLLGWADSVEHYEHALRTLVAGRPYVLTLTDYDAVYSLRLDPVPVRRPAPTTPVSTRGVRPSSGTGRHRRTTPRRRERTR